MLYYVGQTSAPSHTAGSLSFQGTVTMARTRAASICPTPGCPNDQPCPEHTRQAWAGSDRRSRLPNNWDATVRRIRRRDHNTCQLCHGTRCGNQRLEVDHIDRGDDHRDANLQTLGHDCHQAKTLAEATEARRTPSPRGA